MSPKISEALARQLDEATMTEPRRQIPVIITLKSRTDLAALEQAGLKIVRIYENIPAIAGTIPASEVNALAELDQVESIDADETAWAL